MRVWHRVGAVALAVAAIAAGIAGGEPARGQADDSQSRPNIVVVMTDDQTQASLAKLPTVTSQLAARGTTFANNFTNWPLCCPSRVDLLHGPVRPQPRRPRQHAARRRLRQLRRLRARCPCGCSSAGYRTIHIGKYLNGYGDANTDPAVRPARLGRVVRGAPATAPQRVYDYQLNQNGSLVSHGTSRADFKQDVFTDLAVEAINRNAPHGAVLHGGHVHGPAFGRAEPEPAATVQLRRHRQAGAATRDVLQRRAPSPSRRASTRPTSPTSRAAIQQPDADRRRRGGRHPAHAIAAGSSRCCPSTRASGGSSTRSRPPASSTTRWSSSPPTTGSSPASTASARARTASMRRRSGSRW